MRSRTGARSRIVVRARGGRTPCGPPPRGSPRAAWLARPAVARARRETGHSDTPTTAASRVSPTPGAREASSHRGPGEAGHGNGRTATRAGESAPQPLDGHSADGPRVDARDHRQLVAPGMTG